MTPKFEALAETSLLMDGLNQSNYRGLERLLQQKPTDVDSWTFARGQALLIAETCNLLLLRPPRSGGRDEWYTDAMDLRTAAADLARSTGQRDYDGSVAGLKTWLRPATAAMRRSACPPTSVRVVSRSTS